MYCRIFAAVTLLAGSTVLALAQETPPPPPTDGGPQAPQAAPGTPPLPPGPGRGADDRKWSHGKHHWQHHRRHGGNHHRGHAMRGKGFELSLGRHHELQVLCGDEPIKACIDASAPLIEALSGGSTPQPAMDDNGGVEMAPGRPANDE